MAAQSLESIEKSVPFPCRLEMNLVKFIEEELYAAIPLLSIQLIHLAPPDQFPLTQFFPF